MKARKRPRLLPVFSCTSPSYAHRVIAILALAAFSLVWSVLLFAGESKPVTYVDVTKSSGIHFEDHNSATPEKYLIETMTGGAAIFD